MTGTEMQREETPTWPYSMDKLIAKRMRLLDWEAFLLTFVRASALPKAEPSIWKMELPDVVVAAWFISRGNGGKV